MHYATLAALLVSNLSVFFIAVLLAQSTGMGMGKMISLHYYREIARVQGALAGPNKPSCAAGPSSSLFTMTAPANVATTKQNLHAATGTLKQYLSTHRNALDAQQLISLAQARKQHLLALMRDDPTAAVAELLSKDERDALNASTVNCAEKQVTIRGTMEVITGDDFENKTSFTNYAVKTAGDKKIELYAAHEQPSLISSQTITVSGLLVDASLLYDGSVEQSNQTSELGSLTVTQAAAVSTIGAQKTLVLLVDFQNVSHFPGNEVNDWISHMNNVNNYYRENSYNQSWLSGVINPSQAADFVGWFIIPMDQTCNYSAVSDQAMITANTPELDYTQYSRLIVLANYSCGLASSSIGPHTVSTPDGVAQMNIIWVRNGAGEDAVRHELGHNLGLLHAKYIYCGANVFPESGSCTTNEYGDLYDVMGNGRGHFNGPHKESLGWFNQGDIQTITTDGSYTIAPIETLPNGVAKKALKLQRTASDYLYIEYRQPLGFDSGLDYSGTSNVFQGVLLHIPYTLYSNTSGTYLVDATPPSDSQALTSALTVGQSVVDPLTRASFRTVSISPTEAVVSVDVCTDFTGPTITLTAPAPGQSVSGQATVTVQASDPSGITKVEFTDPYGSVSTDTTAPYQMMFDTTHLLNGTSSVSVVAYDNASSLCGLDIPPDNMTSQNFTINILNVDSVPPAVSLTAPTTGSLYTSPVIVNANASDNVGIYRMTICQVGEDFMMFPCAGRPLDKFLASFSIPPYSKSVYFNPGIYTVYAFAQDYVGNEAESTPVTFAVSSAPDITAPTVSITSPVNGATVGGTAWLITSAPLDNIGVFKVEFYKDSDTTPFSVATYPTVQTVWNTTSVPNGTHTIKAKAIDFSGNSTLSNPVTVKVYNSSGGKKSPQQRLPE